MPPDSSAGIYSSGGKTVGLFFDGDKVVVQHIAPDDSNSHTMDDGSLSAHGTGMPSLSELAKYCHETGSRKVNEVNISTVGMDACIGVVSTGSALSRIEAAIAQDRIFRKTKKILPILEYDQKTGSLTELTEPQIQMAINQVSREGYSQEYVDAMKTAMNREGLALEMAKELVSEISQFLSDVLIPATFKATAPVMNEMSKDLVKALKSRER